MHTIKENPQSMPRKKLRKQLKQDEKDYCVPVSKAR